MINHNKVFKETRFYYAPFYKLYRCIVLFKRICLHKMFYQVAESLYLMEFWEHVSCPALLHDQSCSVTLCENNNSILHLNSDWLAGLSHI